jgi:hypothetical protein
MLDRAIIARPDFLDSSTEVLSRMGTTICEAKGLPPSFAGIEYGAFIGDSTVAAAAAYSAMKNGTGLRDASVATLAFHCYYKAKKLKGRGVLSFAVSRSKQNELDDIAHIMDYLRPLADEVLARIHYEQFLEDSAAFLRSS